MFEEVSADARSRIKTIELYSYNKQQEFEERIREKTEKFYCLNNQIRTLYPRVKDMVAVACCCNENHIPIDSFKITKGKSKAISFDIASGKVLLALEIPPNSAIGMYAGSLGLCDRNGVSILTLKDNLNLYSYNDVMERFIDAFDEFEQRFYEYVDDIVLDEKVIDQLSITKQRIHS